MSIDDVLNEREKTHGDFPTQAITAQELKHRLRNTPNWPKLPEYMRESLELICTKLARMTHGNWKDVDHPKDGSGYFELIVRELKK